MSSLSLVLLLCACVGSALASPTSSGRNQKQSFYLLENADSLFENFLATYNKNYTSKHEKAKRLSIFTESLATINTLNANSRHASFAINKFADLTPKEFSERYTGFRPSEDSNLRRQENSAEKDSSEKCNDNDSDENDDSEYFDWRDQGVVTRVKDQRNCGSCWAFSTVGAVESAYAIKHKKLRELSEQQLVDCDGEDSGCGGGEMANALTYLSDVGGSESEKAYGYKGKRGTCRFEERKIVAEVSGFIRPNIQSEDTLKHDLKTIAPIAIAIDAFILQFYSSGVIVICPGFNINHAVLLVGYGKELLIPYWSIKNSWGGNWGEHGYFRVARNFNGCGLLNEYAVIPQVN